MATNDRRSRIDFHPTSVSRSLPAALLLGMMGTGCVAEVTPDRVEGDEEDKAVATVDSALSAREVAQIAHTAGVPCGRGLVEAVAVAYGESTWVPTATNHNTGGSTDHGLWQINDFYWGPFECDIYDPACNADYMVRISNHGRDWSPWHAHGRSLYRSALDDAEKAEAAVCDSCAKYDGTFADDDGSVHESNIEAIAAAGITNGCSDEPCPQYCPGRALPRDQMAAFLARAFELPAASRDYFVDDDGNPFESDIERVAEAGITLGCNPPDNTRFCPDRVVDRGQMASFLARALALPAASRDYFVDDDGSVHEANIDKLREAGITLGCNPPDNTRYCPRQEVTRAQMATFLARALGL